MENLALEKAVIRYSILCKALRRCLSQEKTAVRNLVKGMTAVKYHCLEKAITLDLVMEKALVLSHTFQKPGGRGSIHYISNDLMDKSKNGLLWKKYLPS